MRRKLIFILLFQVMNTYTVYVYTYIQKASRLKVKSLNCYFPGIAKSTKSKYTKT